MAGLLQYRVILIPVY